MPMPMPMPIPSKTNNSRMNKPNTKKAKPLGTTKILF